MTHIPVKTAEEVVTGQFNALNTRDIEAFMSYWWEDAQFYEHPSKLMADGAPEIQRQMLESFERRSYTQVELVSRLSLDDRIIEHVNVTETGPRGPMKVNVVAIYVEGEKIKTAWFIVALVPRPPQILA
ncbi:nuclear transport factor 2 family protein [Deinococcus sp. QL22]|uniref:nuclear transport factor 2 family protein n=1 Tax=Deinococcus sp. QL22 TaxID=2939437 RepID=UPI00201751B2|nr:nuclear transport factor 2 family protein [Deinococcus sp. QL22]UQN09939.1 nuclear transport factor 2 family protein [Deinococcus sp. QL22]